MSRLLPLSALLLSSLASAAAPARMPVQGTLANTDGTPVVGDLPVVFTLYGAEDGTDAFWTETATVAFNDGTFTVYLGESSTLDLAQFRDHSGVWLGIAVDGDAEMDLIEVDTVPYAAFAQYAGDAASVGGVVSADLLTVGYQPSWTDVQGVPASLQTGLTAGNGVVLTNGTLSIDSTVVQGMATGVCFSDETDLTALLDDNYVPTGWQPAWADVMFRPAGLDDGDDDTTYTNGAGITLTGNTFAADQAYVDARAAAVCYDTESELTALLNDNYLPATYAPAWGTLTGVPAGIADGDNDTTYTAGAGMKLTTNSFAVDSAKVPVAATYTKKVKIRSAGNNTGSGGSITVAGTVALTVARSYGLVIIDRASGAVDFAQSYDVYGNPLEATAMATKLGTVNSTKIVIVATSDEPQANRTANGLQAQMLRCGASRNYADGFYLADGLTRAFRYRSAYAMVGICGGGPNTGSEWYSGEIDNDATANVDAAVLIMDGDVIGGR